MRVLRPLSLAAAAVAVGAFAVPGSGAPSRGPSGGEQNAGPYTGVGTGVVNRYRHIENSSVTSDSTDIYAARFTYSFRIENGAVRGTGSGRYTRATWRLEGTYNGNRFGCDVPITARPFQVAVSGSATGRTMTLKFRLVGARETNQDHPCGAGYTGFAANNTHLADSLALVQGSGLSVSRATPKIPTLSRRVETGDRSDGRVIRHDWAITIRGPGASGSTGQPAQGEPTTCFGRNATTSSNTGTPGDDVLIGGAGNDTLSGLGGNDRICGGGGKDTIVAGDGNDFVEGNDGNDSLKGGLGDDRLVGLEGNDTLKGEDGNDHLQGGNGNDTMDGGDGNDTLIANDGNDRLEGGKGDDELRGQDGRDRLDGETGNDRVYGGADDDVLAESISASDPSALDQLYGEEGDDRIRSSFTRNRMDGGPGDDVIESYFYRDSVYGGPGNDRIRIYSNPVSRDEVFGGPGDDVIEPLQSGFANGDDVIDGEGGYDRIKGGGGIDKIQGGPGDDTIAGGKGHDTVSGGAGRDKIDGDSGNDDLAGGEDDDTINGDSGSDRLQGEAGDDQLRGGSGGDVVVGGPGTDDCEGEQLSECE